MVKIGCIGHGGMGRPIATSPDPLDRLSIRNEGGQR
ncbi:hypothetical protein SAMN04489812_1288 [Microlunatus soli]|uniref:Uncharacterized protein n=1 Tax=Microlunatus soli TaxID=630515 RepID=A0A1H1QJ54_9ACTN|nr:hypothetical protein SAMN04489812_1288 [Microlunatus soli]